jgi:hypothetical protein
LIVAESGWARRTAITTDRAILRSVESRAEVESLDELHQARRELMPQFAALKALHGTFGLYDAKRKAILAAIHIRVRMELRDAQEKVTEALVDSMAHADEQYQRFLDESLTDRIRFIELDTEVSELEERIRSREIELGCYRSELSLR